MPLDLPNLDDRTYKDLVAEALALIPSHAPEWTNHNESDPGITIIELFAYFTETLIYRQNRVTEANLRMFLKLLNGPDWQPSDDLRQDVRRAVLSVRDPYRAITCEDFEQLAIAADPQVARAHCIPRRNLESNEASVDESAHISVIIVPVANLQPSDALIQTVTEYLEDRRLLTTKIHVVAPHYLTIGVRLKLHLRREAREEDIRDRVTTALEQFFHPLTGGSNQQGWPFGRNIYVSEIYQLLDRLPGVDYVEKVQRNEQPLDELTLAASESNRFIRNADNELVAIALQPNELVATQINLDEIEIDSPIQPIELPTSNP